MHEIILEGKTVEEAIEQGLAQLGVSRDKVEVEVLDEGKAGLFGLMGKMAQVRMRLQEDPLTRALRVLREILSHMNITAEVTGQMVEGVAEINIEGAGGVLIGRRGDTLSSLQYLINRILNQDQDNWDRINVDVEGYRKRREVEMKDLAERSYRKVLDSGKPMSIKNLSAHDRRIIHMTLKERQGIETYSHGEGHLRKLVITPKGQSRRQDAERDRGGRDRGRGRDRDRDRDRNRDRDRDRGSRGMGASDRVRSFTKRFESPSGNNQGN